MADFVSSVEAIPEAIDSENIALTHIKYSFLASVGAFIVFIPFYRSRKSFFDALAARNVMRIVRIFLFLELLSVFMLFYYYFAYGSPINLHAQWSYGNGDSWLYGFGRPTCTLIFVCVIGVVSDMHPFIRWLVMAAGGLEALGDALSAYQVRDYYSQIQGNSAPNNGYSPDNLLAYYWRDIASFGLSMTIVLMVALLTCIVGWCPPQLIHPSLISGERDMDRFEVMHDQRSRRRHMEQRGFLGPIPQHRAKPSVSAMLLRSATADRGQAAVASANEEDNDDARQQLLGRDEEQGGRGDDDDDDGDDGDRREEESDAGERAAAASAKAGGSNGDDVDNNGGSHREGNSSDGRLYFRGGEGGQGEDDEEEALL